MEKLNSTSGNRAFLVVGYFEDSNRAVSGPHPVGSEATLSRASELCLSLLWLGKSKWHALSILSATEFREVVTYRRFPPGRVKEFLYDGVVVRDTDSPFAKSPAGQGARLLIGVNGARFKSFGSK